MPAGADRSIARWQRGKPQSLDKRAGRWRAGRSPQVRQDAMLRSRSPFGCGAKGGLLPTGMVSAPSEVHDDRVGPSTPRSVTQVRANDARVQRSAYSRWDRRDGILRLRKPTERLGLVAVVAGPQDCAVEFGCDHGLESGGGKSLGILPTRPVGMVLRRKTRQANRRQRERLFKAIVVDRKIVVIYPKLR